MSNFIIYFSSFLYLILSLTISSFASDGSSSGSAAILGSPEESFYEPRDRNVKRARVEPTGGGESPLVSAHTESLSSVVTVSDDSIDISHSASTGAARPRSSLSSISELSRRSSKTLGARKPKAANKSQGKPDTDIRSFIPGFKAPARVPLAPKVVVEPEPLRLATRPGATNAFDVLMGVKTLQRRAVAAVSTDKENVIPGEDVLDGAAAKPSGFVAASSLLRFGEAEINEAGRPSKHIAASALASHKRGWYVSEHGNWVLPLQGGEYATICMHIGTLKYRSDENMVPYRITSIDAGKELAEYLAVCDGLRL